MEQPDLIEIMEAVIKNRHSGTAISVSKATGACVMNTALQSAVAPAVTDDVVHWVGCCPKDHRVTGLAEPGLGHTSAEYTRSGDTLQFQVFRIDWT